MNYNLESLLYFLQINMIECFTYMHVFTSVIINAFKLNEKFGTLY